MKSKSMGFHWYPCVSLFCIFLASVGNANETLENIICNPFGSPTGTVTNENGWSGDVSYLPNPSRVHYTCVDDFESQCTAIKSPLYLDQIDVPAETFSGFTSNGAAITLPDGQPLVENFALNLRSVLKLTANNTAGNYQFALLSSSGAVLRIDTGYGSRRLIDNENGDASTLACADFAVKMSDSTQLPMTLDYAQGDTQNMQLILLWRPVPDETNSCKSAGLFDDRGDDHLAADLRDPACGQRGVTYFNSSVSPSAPTQDWINLLARGWSVVPAQNFFLPGNSNNPCNTGTQCYSDKFMQPAQQWNVPSVDLLLMTDASQSKLFNSYGECTNMNMGDRDGEHQGSGNGNSYDRNGIAQYLYEFSRQLPSGVDYRVGLMAGYGSESPLHGKLLSGYGAPSVLSSLSYSAQDLEYLFSLDLASVNSSGTDLGELGMYSLSSSIQGGLLTGNQAEGFFRSGAALGVIFLSDSPDQCAVNPSAYPECSGITPQAVLEQLQTLKSGKPLTVDAIVDTNTSDAAHYGAGYIQMADLAGGLAINLDANQNGQVTIYSQALQAIGQSVSAGIQAAGSNPLLNEFALTQQGVDPSTISVNVNGSPTQFSYEGSQNSVDLTNAGSYGAIVQVNYCLAPSPSPSPSPSVSPSPSPSVSPSPSPSVSPSPSPSVSPSPSPSVSPSPSPSASPSPSPSASPSPSPSASASPSPSPSASPSPSPSASASPSPSPSASPSPSPSASPSPSPSASASPSPSPSASASPSPSPSASPSPSPSASPSPSPSPSPSTCVGPFCGGGVLGS